MNVVQVAKMAATALAVNSSLLPSQSIFNEIQSIHETGFFHEIESFAKEEAPGMVRPALDSNATHRAYNKLQQYIKYMEYCVYKFP